MTRMLCQSYDALPDNPDSFPPNAEGFEFIICPEVEFPLRAGKHDFCFGTSEDFPFNYRLKFLHPSRYLAEASFTRDGYKKIDVLRILAKRGATIVFIVDSQKENSLINACCLLRECYQDCLNEIAPNTTNIPFPVKKADFPPYDWIWSCYWNESIPERLDEKQSKKFICTVRFEFLSYDGRGFPVDIIDKCKEGVTAFSVKVKKGQVLVVTPNTKRSFIESEECEEPVQDKMFITVNEFPARLSLADNHTRVKYDISYKGQTYYQKAPGLSFLRLLTVYYASQEDNSFGFTINEDNKLDNVSVMNAGSHPERIEWACIFKSPNGTADVSFLRTLGRFIKLVLPKEHEDEAYQIITGRHPGGHREQEAGFMIEKLNNLTIQFSDAAFRNFEVFTLRGEEPRDAAFTSVLSTFKNSISPVVKP